MTSGSERPQQSFYNDPATAHWLADLPTFAGERSVLSSLSRQGRRLSDVGAGSGRLVNLAVSLGYEYRACDPAPAQIAELLRRHPGVNATVAPGEALPWEAGTADVVVLAFHVIEFVQPRSKRLAVLGEAHRVLAGGGVLVFSHHHAWRYRLGSQIRHAALSRSSTSEWGDLLASGKVSTGGITVDNLSMHLLWPWELRSLAASTGFAEVGSFPMKTTRRRFGLVPDLNVIRVWEKS